MNDQQLNLVSLFSRIEQLEQHILIVRKYATGLKRQLDCVTEMFNNRPELQEWEFFKREFAELKKQQNIILGLSDRTFNSQTLDSPPSNDPKEDAEIVKEFFARVDRQLQQDSLTPTFEASQELASNDEQIVSFSNEEIDTVEQKILFSVFTDEEFKIERMLLLLMKYEADEQESQETPVSAEDFLQRYNEGERDFTGINLAGVDLSGKSFTIDYDCNLSNANLSEANLSGSCLVFVNLEGANFTGANLSRASLKNLSGANLTNANLSEAKLEGAKLIGANLTKADLFHADLRNATITEASLKEAQLSKANLTNAKLNNSNLTKAKLIGTDLQSAKLRNVNFSGADLTKANLKGNSCYTNEPIDLQGVNLEGAI
ncbi:MAG: pentapeptide repeat-containing protein, partial [Phormidium sp.]